MIHSGVWRNGGHFLLNRQDKFAVEGCQDWFRYQINHWTLEHSKKMEKHGTSVCTIAGLCVLNIFTVWKMSTTPSYLIRSRTMLRVMKTPVLPTPALCKGEQRGQWRCWSRSLIPLIYKIHLPKFHPPPGKTEVVVIGLINRGCCLQTQNTTL